MHLQNFALRYRSPKDFPARFTLPEVPRMVETARKLGEIFPNVAPPPPVEELVHIAHFLEKCALNNDYAQVEPKDWRKAPWCLWLKEKPLGENKKFLYFFLEKITKEFDRRTCKALIGAYLLAYNPEDALCKAVSIFLANAVTKHAWEWHDHQNNYKMFDVALAPELLAQAVTYFPDDMQAFFYSVGFRGLYGQNNLLIATIRNIIHVLQQELESNTKSTALLEKVLQGVVKDDRIAYPELMTPLAEALLLPWSNRQPSDAVKTTIQKFLLQHYKDPRLNTSRWMPISAEAKNVFLQWLTKETLRQFIQIIDATAQQEHWDARRDFWMYYADKNYIAKAWVVFAIKGAQYCKSHFENSSFAEFTTGALGDHAVLLMSIGDLIIADWSHNGKCRIWQHNNPNAPQLFQMRYDGGALKALCDMDNMGYNATNGHGDGVMHFGSDRGNWQRKVAGFIQYHTGIQHKNHGS